MTAADRLSWIRKVVDQHERDNWLDGIWATETIRFLLDRLDQTQARIEYLELELRNKDQAIQGWKDRLDQCQTDLAESQHQVRRLQADERWLAGIQEARATSDRLAEANQHIQTLVETSELDWDLTGRAWRCHYCQALEVQETGQFQHDQDCAWQQAKQWTEDAS